MSNFCFRPTKIPICFRFRKLPLAAKFLVSCLRQSYDCRRYSLTNHYFTRIDTGTSGEMADKMGRIMQDMSRNMQVIAITHLPQIASKGDFHYIVYKKIPKILHRPICGNCLPKSELPKLPVCSAARKLRRRPSKMRR